MSEGATCSAIRSPGDWWSVREFAVVSVRKPDKRKMDSQRCHLAQGIGVGLRMKGREREGTGKGRGDTYMYKLACFFLPSFSSLIKT